MPHAAVSSPRRSTQSSSPSSAAVSSSSSSASSSMSFSSSSGSTSHTPRSNAWWFWLSSTPSSPPRKQNRLPNHLRRRSALRVAMVGAVALYATLGETLRRNVRFSAHVVGGIDGDREGGQLVGVVGTSSHSSSSSSSSLGRPPTQTGKSTVKTWADTSQGQVCHNMFRWELRGASLAYGVTWDRLRPALLNASYYPPQFAHLPRFRSWIDHLFDFYTFERLQRSRAHPAPRESIKSLWSVIHKRLQDPIHNGPVRIAVFGGSVTTGRDCQQNPVDLPGTDEPDQTHRWCAYAHLLHVMLDQALFPHRSEQDRSDFPVFEVTNMAVQATNSEVGAMAIEYHLLPALETSPPHMVIHSYSANDAEDDEEPTFWTHQQSFVRAAHNIWPCDDHLPLVVLADDWLGHGLFVTPGLVNTGSLYKTASWHNVMAIMYTNVVRSAALYHSNFTKADAHPLFGSKRWSMSHLGMGFHMAQAWTLFYNVVGALHDACAEVQREPAPALPEEKAAKAKAASNRTREKFPILAPPLPTKHVGRYDWAGPNVLREWDENVKFKARLCEADGRNNSNHHHNHSNNAAAAAPAYREDRPPYATANCEYAWMVNSMTNVWVGSDVQEAIESVLVDQKGWEVVDQTPKSGWSTNLTEAHHLAHGERPHFTIELRNISQPVDTFTLLSLKSYGPEWDGSRLDVKITRLPGATAAAALGDERGADRRTVVVRGSVRGHHDKKISVAYPHRFRLKGSGARVGDTLRATFTLAGGRNFKISGLAFCRSLTATV